MVCTLDYGVPCFSVLSAALTVSVGELQELTLTVPRSYYDLNYTRWGRTPEYAYINGYGGKIEGISISDLQVTLTAKSSAGSNLMEYKHINPHVGYGDTVRSWLSNLAGEVNADAVFVGDDIILNSEPETYDLASGVLFSVLVQLAACYGLDVIHMAKNGEDVFKFAHVANMTAARINNVLSMSINGEKIKYDYIGIEKTSSISSKDSTLFSVEEMPFSAIQYTAAGMPYLEGVWSFKSLTQGGAFGNHSVNHLAGTLDRSRMQALNAPFVLNWNESYGTELSDPELPEGHAVAPVFDTMIVQKSRRLNTGESIQDKYDYRELDETEKVYHFGLWPMGAANIWGEYEAESRESRYQNGQTQTNSDSYNGDLGANDAFYVYSGHFLVTYEERVKSTEERNHYSDDNTPIERYNSQYEYVARLLSNPSLASYPWLPFAREVSNKASKDRVINTTRTEGVDDSKESGEYLDKNEWQVVNVTESLFSGDFDDTYHPTTIDPNPPVDISLSKHSESWFDPTASPSADYQYMGLGEAANIAYQLGQKNYSMVLSTTLYHGALTVYRNNGTKIMRYNPGEECNLEDFYGGSTVTGVTTLCNGQSFSTLTGSEQGEGYIITGTVWSSKAVAQACLPYIEKQQNREKQTSFSVPLLIMSLDNAVSTVGCVCEVRGKNVYITSVRVDFNSEIIVFSGCLIMV